MYNRSIKPHCLPNRLGSFPRSCVIRSGAFFCLVVLARLMQGTAQLLTPDAPAEAGTHPPGDISPVLVEVRVIPDTVDAGPFAALNDDTL